MSKLFKIGYELSDRSSFSVGIISDTKEKALSYLKVRVPSVSKINSVTSSGDVHAVDDEIINRFISNSDKVQKYQQRIKNLNEQLKEYEVDIENMKEELNNTKQQPTLSSKDIKEALKPQQKEEIKKIYICPYCNFETKKKSGLRTHISRTHKNEK